MKSDNMHLLRPELMFLDSFKVSGPLNDSAKRCLIAAFIGLIIGMLVSLAI